MLYYGTISCTLHSSLRRLQFLAPPYSDPSHANCRPPNSHAFCVSLTHSCLASAKFLQSHAIFLKISPYIRHILPVHLRILLISRNFCVNYAFLARLSLFLSKLGWELWLTVSLVCGIVMPRSTSYALNDNIQLKYLSYFQDIPLLSCDIFSYFNDIFWYYYPTVIYLHQLPKGAKFIEYNYFNFNSSSNWHTL